jgi:hypothetical protein
LNKIKRKADQLATFPESGIPIPQLDDLNPVSYRETIESPWKTIYQGSPPRLFYHPPV